MRRWWPIRWGRGGDPTIAQPDHGAADPGAAPRRFRPTHRLVICGLLLAVAMIAGSILMLADLRDRALDASERELKNTALILAEQTDRAFQTVELMEDGIVERMAALGVAAAGDF